MAAIAANVIRLGPCGLCGWEGLSRTPRAGHAAIADHFAYVHPTILIRDGDVHDRANTVPHLQFSKKH